MGDPYTDVSISGYNSNPPPDDGTNSAANEIKWSTQKTKLTDPLNTAIQNINTNVGAAVDKLSGGITSTATSYTVLAADQGKTIEATVAGITITTPSAATVGSPFKFKVLNNSTGDITVDGSGSQTIDGDTSITIPAGAGADFDTDGSNWKTAGQNFASAPTPPQGYLTLVSGTPIIVSDQSAKTAVYYALHVGNRVPIPNGTTFKMFAITEKTLTLASQHTASNIFDVFLFEDPGNPGSIVIGTGPAWTTATAGSGARGTGAGTTEISRLLGLYVNTVQITARNGATTYTVAASSALYVGSLFIDGTNGQVSCHVTYGQSRKWGVWNAYNRTCIYLKAGDATASWAYTTATIRASNNSSANSLTVFSGLAESPYNFEFSQYVDYDNQLVSSVGVGYNSTSAYSGKIGTMGNTTNNTIATSDVTNARYMALPALGVNVITALEKGGGGSNDTFYGTETNMLLTAQWWG